MALSASFIKSVWQNRLVRYLLLLMIVLLLAFFSIKHYGNNRYEEGVSHQTAIYEKEQELLKKEYQKRLDAANTDRITLNEEIQKQKDDYQRLKEQRQTKTKVVKEEVIKYAETDNGRRLCLDPDWLRNYQNSLPN